MLELGQREWLIEQLDPDSIDDSELEGRLQAYPSLPMSGQEVLDYFGWYNVSAVIKELRTARLVRAVHSRRQLFERMVEFWTDHFNITGDGGDARFLKTVDDREVIRAHAMGRFPDMLRASAKSGAMLSYLNNDTNEAGHPNENYARELMELHTLGVDGPYTEQDVRELARCLTGWTYVHADDSGDFGEFRFDANFHDDGEKVVLGHVIAPGGGQSDAEFVLDVLADHPSTARHIASKLVRWLISYDPPAGIVNRVAQVYLNTGGSIPDMLRTIFASQAFERARRFDRPKYKRPFHFAVSLLRTFDVPLDSPEDVLWQIRLLGQTPYAWKAPNGFPDDLGAWAPNLLPRWMFSSMLCNGWMMGTSYPINNIVNRFSQIPRQAWANHIDTLLTGRSMSRDDLAELRDFTSSFNSPSDGDVLQVLELAASSPSFQLY